MKNLKQLLGFGVLMGSLMVSTTFAGTGMLLTDGVGSDDTNGCTESTSTIGMLLTDGFALVTNGMLLTDGVSSDDQNNCDAATNGMMLSD